MDSKILRSSQVAFVLMITLLFLASCTPQPPVKPWDSRFLNQIQLSFTDADTDPNQIAGDVLLKLNNAPKPTGIDQYVLYWGGTASDSSKGNKIAEVSINISGDLLTTIPQDTPIPDSRNSYFLLYVKNAGGELYSGISTQVTDETQSEAEKAAAREAAEAARMEEAKKAAEAVKIAEAVKMEEQKKAEEAAQMEEAKKMEEVAKVKEAEVKMKEAEAVKAAEESKTATLRAIVIDNVLFDFDKSDLRPEFKTKLDNAFADVADKDQIKLIISGHADERGSNEYNLALGERRAFAVKRYLISLGLMEENISVISYGEEKPVDPRHNESAWEKNRRAESDIKE
ncbi:MAG: OmpA family protein [bacterium]